MVLANLPGDSDDLVNVFKDEFDHARMSYWEQKLGKSFEEILRSINWIPHGCSNFGAWGNRTANGELYTGMCTSSFVYGWCLYACGAEVHSVHLADSPSAFLCAVHGPTPSIPSFPTRTLVGRNLDWETNTGINDYKYLTIYHPDNQIAHATVGFAGVIGALTGMSANGITVHEANLESDLDSFYGFPWSLRLRYIMAQTDNLDGAINIWNTTNNT